MNKYRNTDKYIHKRIYNFIINCFRNIVKKIPKKTENLPIVEQISSSLTSIGVNDQEADNSITRKDFIAKYLIVRKETKETDYWLKFIKDTKLINKNTVEPYIIECKKILMIISKIIENVKN